MLRLAALEAPLPVNRSKVLRGRNMKVTASVQASCRNQLLFREVNERIREVAGKSGILGPAAFVCECAHADCTEALELALNDYDQVRMRPGAFVIVPGHEAEHEAVAVREAHYNVVLDGLDRPNERKV